MAELEPLSFTISADLSPLEAAIEQAYQLARDARERLESLLKVPISADPVTGKQQSGVQGQDKGSLGTITSDARNALESIRQIRAELSNPFQLKFDTSDLLRAKAQIEGQLGNLAGGGAGFGPPTGDAVRPSSPSVTSAPVTQRTPTGTVTTQTTTTTVAPQQVRPPEPEPAAPVTSIAPTAPVATAPQTHSTGRSVVTTQTTVETPYHGSPTALSELRDPVERAIEQASTPTIPGSAGEATGIPVKRIPPPQGFSRRKLEQRVLEAYEALGDEGAGTYSAQDEHRIEQGGNFAFGGKPVPEGTLKKDLYPEERRTGLRFPEEIRTRLEGREHLARFFTLTDDPSKARGEDLATSLGGHDELFSLLERQYQDQRGKLTRAREFARRQFIDPELQFAEAMLDIIPSQEQRVPQRLVEGSRIESGREFTIHGRKVRSIEDPDDGVVLEGPGFRVPAAALPQVPVDLRPSGRLNIRSTRPTRAELNEPFWLGEEPRPIRAAPKQASAEESVVAEAARVKQPWERTRNEHLAERDAGFRPDLIDKHGDDAKIATFTPKVEGDPYPDVRSAGRLSDADKARLDNEAKAIKERALRQGGEPKKNANPADLKRLDEIRVIAEKEGDLSGIDANRSISAEQHRRDIEYAIKRGESVPPEVLADYPDLQARRPAPREAPRPIQEPRPLSTGTRAAGGGVDLLGEPIFESPRGETEPFGFLQDDEAARRERARNYAPTVEPVQIPRPSEQVGSRAANDPRNTAQLFTPAGHRQPHEMTRGEFYTSELFAPNWPSASLESRERLQGDELVTVFRGLRGDDTRTSLRPGDWVTLNRGLAEDIANVRPGGNQRIIEQQVRRSDLVKMKEIGDELAFVPPEALTAHRSAVEQAIAQGRAVGADVLADYPHLAAPPVSRRPIPALPTPRDRVAPQYDPADLAAALQPQSAAPPQQPPRPPATAAPASPDPFRDPRPFPARPAPGRLPQIAGAPPREPPIAPPISPSAPPPDDRPDRRPFPARPAPGRLPFQPVQPVQPVQPAESEEARRLRLQREEIAQFDRPRTRGLVPETPPARSSQEPVREQRRGVLVPGTPGGANPNEINRETLPGFLEQTRADYIRSVRTGDAKRAATLSNTFDFLRGLPFLESPVEDLPSSRSIREQAKRETRAPQIQERLADQYETKLENRLATDAAKQQKTQRTLTRYEESLPEGDRPFFREQVAQRVAQRGEAPLEAAAVVKAQLQLDDRRFNAELREIERTKTAHIKAVAELDEATFKRDLALAETPGERAGLLEARLAGLPPPPGGGGGGGGGDAPDDPNGPQRRRLETQLARERRAERRNSGLFRNLGFPTGAYYAATFGLFEIGTALASVERGELEARFAETPLQAVRANIEGIRGAQSGILGSSLGLVGNVIGDITPFYSLKKAEQDLREQEFVQQSFLETRQSIRQRTRSEALRQAGRGTFADETLRIQQSADTELDELRDKKDILSGQLNKGVRRTDYSRVVTLPSGEQRYVEDEFFPDITGEARSQLQSQLTQTEKQITEREKAAKADKAELQRVADLRGAVTSVGTRGYSEVRALEGTNLLLDADERRRGAPDAGAQINARRSALETARRAERLGVSVIEDQTRSSRARGRGETGEAEDIDLLTQNRVKFSEAVSKFGDPFKQLANVFVDANGKINARAFAGNIQKIGETVGNLFREGVRGQAAVNEQAAARTRSVQQFEQQTNAQINASRVGRLGFSGQAALAAVEAQFQRIPGTQEFQGAQQFLPGSAERQRYNAAVDRQRLEARAVAQRQVQQQRILETGNLAASAIDLAGNPLESRLTQIRARGRAERVGQDPSSQDYRTSRRQQFFDELLAVRDENRARQLITIGQRGQSQQLDRLLARDTIGAEAINIRSQGTLRAVQLKQAGKGDDLINGELGNSTKELGLLRQNYLDAFRGEQLDTRLITLSTKRPAPTGASRLQGYFARSQARQRRDAARHPTLKKSYYKRAQERKNRDLARKGNLPTGTGREVNVRDVQDPAEVLKGIEEAIKKLNDQIKQGVKDGIVEGAAS